MVLFAAIMALAFCHCYIKPVFLFHVRFKDRINPRRRRVPLACVICYAMCSGGSLPFLTRSVSYSRYRSLSVSAVDGWLVPVSHAWRFLDDEDQSLAKHLCNLRVEALIEVLSLRSPQDEGVERCDRWFHTTRKDCIEKVLPASRD